MNSKAKSVLIVDDEEQLRDVLQMSISKYAEMNEVNLKNIVVAKDGSEAIYKSDNQIFDLYIIDLQMPKKSGIDVIKSLIRAKKAKPESIIVLSGYVDQTSFDYLVIMGVKNIFVKPISLSKLMNRLSKMNF